MTHRPRPFSRAERALLAVLPAIVRPLAVAEAGGRAVVVAGQRIALAWVGEGRLGDVRRALAESRRGERLPVARPWRAGRRFT